MYQLVWMHPSPYADATTGVVVLNPSALEILDTYYRRSMIVFDEAVPDGTAIVGGVYLADVEFFQETDVGGFPVGPAGRGRDEAGQWVYFHFAEKD